LKGNLNGYGERSVGGGLKGGTASQAVTEGGVGGEAASKEEVA
jgi:hypothetical protein